MAVAADSHRDFLIPEAYRHAVAPTTDVITRPDELCYSFVESIIAEFCENCNRIIKINRKKFFDKS